ncbi:MAG: DUF4266 domain-containing protein [Verrucomicrobia bacterium]|nr:DUF4266 domain-containing protein [Verrucomicrobiota bacterium]
MRGEDQGEGSRPSAFAFSRSLCLAGLAAVLLTTGCSNVKPWQRGTLAQYVMRADRDPLHEAMSEHVWFSREAAAGGRGVGGGGCGCN